MKKNILILLIISLLSGAELFAQGSDYNTDTLILDYHNYDSLYLYHNPDLEHDSVFNNYTGCWMWWQSPYPQQRWWRDATSAYYVYRYEGAIHPSYYDSIIGDWCIPNFFRLTNDCEILSTNNYYPEGFGQPFHLDDSVYIVGVAARINGTQFPQSRDAYFRLYDDNMQTELFHSVNYINGISGGICDTTPAKGWWFLNSVDQITDKYKVKDFVIAADVYEFESMVHQHTCSIFDTIWQDTVIGCQAQYSPYIKKGGEWKTFAEDTVYMFWQKMCIEWWPIVYSPRIDNSSIDRAENVNFSYYPNPAKDELHIESPYIIERIEISNMLGVTVKSISAKDSRVTVNISDLAEGTYFITVKTSDHTSVNKFIKE